MYRPNSGQNFPKVANFSQFGISTDTIVLSKVWKFQPDDINFRATGGHSGKVCASQMCEFTWNENNKSCPVQYHKSQKCENKTQHDPNETSTEAITSLNDGIKEQQQ